ncbi:GDP-mannose 4,6-dehydratase [Flavobacterium sp. UBA6031]|uniref:GDP-mannose 4,6-dehydratase n=1 Tax=Flavobacterium sp. UBA6031 TaxID=1946551 RepID=UPI0025C0B074|nr:GDP-mannose 4,6-dehydratase [Flavobacterium sp. UBA6031]
MSINILITGGAGFIGSSLCDLLVISNFNVICLDNFDDFYSENIKRNNIANSISHSNFKLIVGDIRNSKLLDKILQDNKIEIIVHLAAKVGVRNSFIIPEEYFDVNVNGTLQLLKAMQKNNVKNIVFSSSSSVYGNRNGEFSETDITDYQISPYAISKKTCELLTYNFHKNYNINVINLRLFSIYGVRQRPDLVIHKFFNLINNNLPLEIYGDGNDLRDYTYITDLIDGIYQSILLCLNTEYCIYDIINIGNSNPISLNNLLKNIKEVNEKEFTVINLPREKGDVYSTFANISKAKKLINYQPKTNIFEGLIKFKVGLGY